MLLELLRWEAIGCLVAWVVTQKEKRKKKHSVALEHAFSLQLGKLRIFIDRNISK